jgi:hypothetical protein
MGRPKRIRQELLDTARVTNSYGIEIAHISADGTYTVSHIQLLHSIYRACTGTTMGCPIGKLYKAFGASGTWGTDINVYNALIDMEALGIIRVDPPNKSVHPIMSIVRAEAILPQYISLDEERAGLKPLEDENE